MLISDDFLLSVSSYDILTAVDSRGYYTKFTFRFPEWWKRDKVLKIQWRTTIVGHPNMEDRRIWAEAQDAQALRARLIYHFSTRKAVA